MTDKHHKRGCRATLSRAQTTRRIGGLAVALGAWALASCTNLPNEEPLPAIDPRGDRIGVRAYEPATSEERRERRERRAARRGEPLTPPHKTGQDNTLMRVALLLPFSSTSAAARVEADSMLKAAQLALFEGGHSGLVLIPKDTAGTPPGARQAARSAVEDGADVIIGPLFASGVEAAANAIDVESTPIIAFSNDRAATGTGAFLLGLAPEEEIQRLVEYALRQGMARFALLAPDNPYGRRVRDALNTTAQGYGGYLSNYELFPPNANADALTKPARALARYDARRAYNSGGTQTAAATGAQGGGFDVGYDAIILPEGGVRLLTLAPLMPYYDVDPRRVRFMGTSLWRDERVLDEPALDRGWFVDTDPNPRQRFETTYRLAYRQEASRLSSLAYDAVTLVSYLTNPVQYRGLTPETLRADDGFYGVDGIFRFGEDGAVERGLAVFQIRDGELVVLEPAPRTFDEFEAIPRPVIVTPAAAVASPDGIPRPPGYYAPTPGAPGQPVPTPGATGPIPRPPGAEQDDDIPRPTY